MVRDRYGFWVGQWPSGFFKALLLPHPLITESASEQVETWNGAILEQKGSPDQ